MTRIKIAREDELKEGGTKKFPFVKNGKTVEGFLARFQGQLVAYENKCRHLPLSLDFGSDRLFTKEGDFFICHNHNAIYEPLSGLCVRGPCEGEKLRALKIEIVDGEVWLVG